MNVYFVCGHFTHLALFKGLSEFFRVYFPDVRQNLVLNKYPPFELVDLSEYVSGYDSVHPVTQCECVFTTDWETNLSFGNIKRRLGLTRQFLRDSEEFTFEEGSLCLFTDASDTSLSERLLLHKVRSETRRSTVCRVSVGRLGSGRAETNNWLMWLLHNIYAPLGAPPVSVRTERWMVGSRTFYRERKIYDRRIVYSTRWGRQGEDADFFELKYPLVPQPAGVESRRPYVLYTGHGLGPVALFPEMSEQGYIQTTNRIMRKLTELYENEDVDLYYKPHPREVEIRFDLAGFTLFPEKLTSEMVFKRDRSCIRAVYAVASTSVATASLFGIDSYALLNLFDYPQKLLERAKTKILDYTGVVAPKTLEELELPPPLSHRPAGSSTEDLDRAADVFAELMGVSR